MDLQEQYDIVYNLLAGKVRRTIPGGSTFLLKTNSSAPSSPNPPPTPTATKASMRSKRVIQIGKAS